YMLASPLMRGEDLNFSEKGVAEISSKLVGRLVNILTFYELYKDAPHAETVSSHVLDRWILARLNQVVQEVTSGMEAYELDRAARPLLSFVDDFSTWYLRRSRERFKDSSDAPNALRTTREALETFSKIAAPFIPFTAEYVFRRVKQTSDTESVHLAQWPGTRSVDTDVLKEMTEARKLVSIALDIRQKENIKVRQPLAKFEFDASQHAISAGTIAVIAEEINVKEIVRGTRTVLDTHISEALKKEGELRDLIREVQDLRKSAGLEPKDKAILIVPPDKQASVSLHWEELARAANLVDNKPGESFHVQSS